MAVQTVMCTSLHFSLIDESFRHSRRYVDALAQILVRQTQPVASRIFVVDDETKLARRPGLQRQTFSLISMTAGPPHRQGRLVKVYGWICQTRHPRFWMQIVHIFLSKGVHNTQQSSMNMKLCEQHMIQIKSKTSCGKTHATLTR